MRALCLSLVLTAGAVLPLTGYAKTQPAIKATKQDFVGTWFCQNRTESENGVVEVGRTLDTIRADGSMFQLWEAIGYDASNKINGIEYTVVSNHWDYSKGEFKVKDLVIEDYRVYGGDKIAMGEETQIIMKEYWQNVYKEPYGEKVAFTSPAKDHFVFTGLPKSVTLAECKRID